VLHNIIHMNKLHYYTVYSHGKQKHRKQLFYIMIIYHNVTVFIFIFCQINALMSYKKILKIVMLPNF